MCIQLPARISVQMSVKSSSDNSKLGPLVATTATESDTCPPECPLRVEVTMEGIEKKGPCYGKLGPIAIHWRNLDNKTTGMPWPEALKTVKRFRKGTLGRFGQIGDHPGTDGWLDEIAMNEWTTAIQGQTWYGYCHYDMTSRTPKAAWNLYVAREAIENGYNINVSCETFAQVDRAIELGMPAVVIVNSATNRTQITGDGHKVVMCPAVVQDNVTCGGSATTKACGGGTPLCARSDRKFAIGFPSHGVKKNSVNALIKKLELFRTVGAKAPEMVA